MSGWTQYSQDEVHMNIDKMVNIEFIRETLLVFMLGLMCWDMRGRGIYRTIWREKIIYGFKTGSWCRGWVGLDRNPTARTCTTSSPRRSWNPWSENLHIEAPPTHHDMLCEDFPQGSLTRRTLKQGSQINLTCKSSQDPTCDMETPSTYAYIYPKIILPRGEAVTPQVEALAFIVSITINPKFIYPCRVHL